MSPSHPPTKPKSLSLLNEKQPRGLPMQAALQMACAFSLFISSRMPRYMRAELMISVRLGSTICATWGDPVFLSLGFRGLDVDRMHGVQDRLVRNLHQIGAELLLD